MPSVYTKPAPSNVIVSENLTRLGRSGLAGGPGSNQTVPGIHGRESGRSQNFKNDF